MCLKNEHGGGIPGQSCVMAAVLHSPLSPSFWCLFLGHANIRCPPLVPSGHGAVCAATETIFTSLLDVSNRNPRAEKVPSSCEATKKKYAALIFPLCYTARPRSASVCLLFHSTTLLSVCICVMWRQSVNLILLFFFPLSFTSAWGTPLCCRGQV